MIVVLALIAAGVLAVGCRQDEPTGATVPPKSGGPITIDGSATLLPVSRALADEFQRDHRGVTVAIGYEFKGGHDGESPQAGLVDIKGTLYGTTSVGGTAGRGTVFKLRP